MEYIFDIFLVIYDSILASIFFTKINGYRIKDKIGFIIFLTIILSVLTQVMNNGFELSVIIICILVSYFFMRVFKFANITRMRCFWSSLSYYFILMLNNTFILNIFAFLKKNEQIFPNNKSYFFMCIISKITLFTIVFSLILIADKLELKQYNSGIKGIVLCALFNLILIAICTYSNINQNYDYNLVVGFIMISLTASCFSNFYMYARLSHKTKLEVELQLIREETNYEFRHHIQEKEHYEKIRRINHDIKNHLLHISYCINTNRCDKALEYLNAIDKQNYDFKGNISLSNDMLNYIINYKADLAKKNNISIEGNIEDINDPVIDNLDLCTLLGNLLDNAIEASKIEKSPKIKIEIFNYNGYQIYLVKNFISSSVFASNSKLETSKDDKENHGLGLKQILSIVEKYDGILDIYEKEQYFTVKILIPQK